MLLADSSEKFVASGSDEMANRISSAVAAQIALLSINDPMWASCIY